MVNLYEILILLINNVTTKNVIAFTIGKVSPKDKLLPNNIYASHVTINTFEIFLLEDPPNINKELITCIPLNPKCVSSTIFYFATRNTHLSIFIIYVIVPVVIVAFTYV